jgi:hypothetical protein
VIAPEEDGMVEHHNGWSVLRPWREEALHQGVPAALVSEGLRTALGVLLSLSDAELATIEERLPLIRRTVRDFEDETTSLGIVDLQDEGLIEATVSEMDGDLEKLLRDGPADAGSESA